MPTVYKLRPHTAEWFTRLIEFNAMQAGMTAATVRRVGHDRCCSICGDTSPIADYEIVKPKPHPGAVITIRLCDECRDIRREHEGEDFIPLQL